MGRRISDSDPSGKKPCAFCRTMRVVVIFAVMVVMLMAYANKLHWLEDVDFTSLFGYLVVAFFFTVLGYRVWDEYGRPKPSQADLEAKRALREQQFDELDALEAERALAELSESAEAEATEAKASKLDVSEIEINEQLNQNVQPESESGSNPEQLDLLGFSTHNKANK
jgi:Zn-dependent protease with chaperone function|tara:strand:- start:541 stop:1044 length:504 start_codon:yes stop_codon:yes gene_type:complete